jgi:hypothetical protein
MKTWGLVVVVLLVCAAPAAAQGITLPVEGATAVWVQPFGGEPGSYGAAVSIRGPDLDVGGFNLAEFIKAELVFHQVGERIDIDPGLSLALQTDVGVPVKVGLMYLPLAKYKSGWFVGVEVFSQPI